MNETCRTETCWCCNKGHLCDPPPFPTGLNETWTCPECQEIHVSFDATTDARLPAVARRHIPAGTFGWRTNR